jgi:hypothetical protein
MSRRGLRRLLLGPPSPWRRVSELGLSDHVFFAGARRLDVRQLGGRRLDLRLRLANPSERRAAARAAAARRPGWAAARAARAARRRAARRAEARRATPTATVARERASAVLLAVRPRERVAREPISTQDGRRLARLVQLGGRDGRRLARLVRLNGGQLGGRRLDVRHRRQRLLANAPPLSSSPSVRGSALPANPSPLRTGGGSRGSCSSELPMMDAAMASASSGRDLTVSKR